MKEGAVQELRLRRNKLESVSVTRAGDKYESKQVTLIPEVRYSYATGVIDSSLFLAGQKPA
jgi:hypothetical protein